MLKDLFQNRLFIGALVFFILCVGGSLLYQQHVYKETDKALAETKEFQEWWKARHATPPSDATETPKSEVVETVETVASPVNDPSVDEAETENFPDFASLSPEEQQQIFDQFYLQRGLKRLTPKELDGLYHQITAEISQMSSEEELNRGLDFSKYTPKQLAHLQTVGIDLSRLPQKLQDKITDHQWRQKGVEPPPAGYTYLQREDGT